MNLICNSQQHIRTSSLQFFYTCPGSTEYNKQGVKTSVIPTTVNSGTLSRQFGNLVISSLLQHIHQIKGKNSGKHQEAILQPQCPSRTSCNINKDFKVNYIRDWMYSYILKVGLCPKNVEHSRCGEFSVHSPKSCATGIYQLFSVKFTREQKKNSCWVRFVQSQQQAHSIMVVFI